MDKMIYLVGPSGSGKTAIMKRYEEKYGAQSCVLKEADIDTARNLAPGCEARIVYVCRNKTDILAALKQRCMTEQNFRTRTCKLMAEDSRARRQADFAVDNTGGIEVAVDQLHEIVSVSEPDLWAPTDELVRRLVEVVLDDDFRLERADGQDLWTYEVPAERSDRLTPEQVSQILGEDLSYDGYRDWVYEFLVDEFVWGLGDAREEIEKDVLADMPVLTRTDLARSTLDDCLAVVPPLEHYLDQEYAVDIVLDAGDSDTDFAVNNIAPALYGERESIDERSGVLWLSRQQGYSKQALEQSLFGEEGDNNAFLASVWDELANTTTSMFAVTFLVKLSLDELFRLNGAINGIRKGSVKIGRKTMTGLVDFWAGAGGPIGIELDRDVEIPIEKVFFALPDTSRMSCGVYCVADIYGMMDSAWGRDATTVDICDESAGPRQTR